MQPHILKLGEAVFISLSVHVKFDIIIFIIAKYFSHLHMTLREIYIFYDVDNFRLNLFFRPMGLVFMCLSDDKKTLSFHGDSGAKRGRRFFAHHSNKKGTE